MLLIGNSGVGKSCLLLRYAENSFNENFFNTIGVDFKLKTVKHEGNIIKLQIWDTAGQERFRTLTASYYRGAQGIIIVYDVTDRETFDNVRTWISEIEKYSQAGVCKILVGNKCDIEDKRQVPREEGEELAAQFQMPFIETSAKASLNVDEAFVTMTKEIKEKNLKSCAPKVTASASSLGQGRALEMPQANEDMATPMHLGQQQRKPSKQQGCC